MSRRAQAILAGIVALVLGLGIFVACSVGGEEPNGNGASPTPSDPSTSDVPTQDQGWSLDEVSAALYGGADDVVIGSVEGAVPDRASPHPALVEVTEVRAYEDSTVVRFRLRNVDDSDPLLSLDSFNRQTPLTKDIRDVALVDVANDVRLQPFLGVPVDGERRGSFCTCSAHPTQMSQVGQTLSGTFPPLDPSADEVTFEVPGFPPLEGLPVTRG